MALHGVSLALLGLLVSLSAAPASSQTSSTGCIAQGAFNASKNYYPDPLRLDLETVPLGTTVQTALDFTVQYGNSFKVVRDSYVNDTYVLYQCGAPKPNDITAPAKYFSVPLSTYATNSTTTVAFLELLGVLGSLRYMDASYETSPCVLKLVESGAIQQLEDPEFGNATVAMQQKSSVSAFIYATLEPSTDIKLVSFDASADPGPLKRAEWIKYLALFFNQEFEAKAIYNQINQSYTCQAAAVSGLPNKPTVAWLSFYKGTWTVSNATYKTQLVSDAGALNLDPSLRKLYKISTPAGLQAFQSMLKMLDVVIDETYAESPASYILANFTANAGLNATSGGYAFLDNKRVWREDRLQNSDTGGLAWFEDAIAQPQAVLHDLIAAFWPTLGVGSNHTYFRNLAAGEPVVSITSAMCTRDPLTPAPVKVVPCPVTVPAATTSIASLASASSRPWARGFVVMAAIVAVLLI